MTLKPYIRKPFYYETDQMAIVHHSNYIRWYEEARVYALEQMGAPIEALEQAGITIPVLSVTSEYHTMVRFGETVRLEMALTKYTGSRMEVAYRLYDQATGVLRNTGTTGHCFLKGVRPVSLKRAAPEFHEIFQRYAGAVTEGMEDLG